MERLGHQHKVERSNEEGKKEKWKKEHRYFVNSCQTQILE
jgi:hypothetical protein